MMGRVEKDQGQFFYAFNLEERIPKGHLLRSIDHFLDLSGLHDHLAPYYSSFCSSASEDPASMTAATAIRIRYIFRSRVLPAGSSCFFPTAPSRRPSGNCSSEIRG